jgi:hypothetical protein
MSLTISLLVSEVGGSGFWIKVSGTPKFKGGNGLDCLRVGNTDSKNLQFANLALSKFPVVGSRYRMIEGES